MLTSFNPRIVLGVYLQVGRKRGISEVVSAMVVLAVIAVVSFYALSNSTKSTADHGYSISHTIEQKGARTQELLAVISQNVLPDQMTLEVINYGTKEFLINKVFVDGDESAFVISNSDGIEIENRTLTPRQILSIHVSRSGQTLQILTGSGNVFSFDLGF